MGRLQDVGCHLSACISRTPPHRLCPELACNWPGGAVGANSLPCTSADVWARQSCNGSSTRTGGGPWGEAGWGARPDALTPPRPRPTSQLCLAPPCSAHSRGVRPCGSCRRRSPPPAARAASPGCGPSRRPRAQVLPSRQRLQQNDENSSGLGKGQAVAGWED